MGLSDHDLGEALHHGEATCDGCGETVDFSDADDRGEAVEIWREHVRSEHGGVSEKERTEDA